MTVFSIETFEEYYLAQITDTYKCIIKGLYKGSWEYGKNLYGLQKWQYYAKVNEKKNTYKLIEKVDQWRNN